MKVAAHPVVTRTDTGDELSHLICCDENRAQCGLDVTEHAWVTDFSHLCVVCDDLDASIAPCSSLDCPYRLSP